MGIEAYTDGACLGNPGPGGWAWAVEDGPYRSGAEARSTNQRMEIKAALEAVHALDGRLEIVSDSTYVVNCFRDRWWEGWIKRGWLTSAKKPVANRDLWEPLVELVEERGDVTFRWVKGHSDDPMNDLVDRLAVEAATTQAGRSGEGRPAELGPADAPESRGAQAREEDPLPPGHRVLVAGLRPPGLGGYGAEGRAVAERVRRRVAEVLAAKAEMHPDLVAVTGLGLGAEQIGVEAAAARGLPYAVVLAHEDADAKWPEESRARFRSLREGAGAVVVLERTVPASKQRAGAAASRRDAWLARHVDEAVVVWDGEDDNVGKVVRSLVVQLGEENVWVVEP